MEDERQRCRHLRLERSHSRSINVFRLSDVEFWLQFRVNKTILQTLLDELVRDSESEIRNLIISGD